MWKDGSVRPETLTFDRLVWRNARRWTGVGILAGIPLMSACATSGIDISLPAPRHSLEGEGPATERAVAPEYRPTATVVGDVRFLDSPEDDFDLGPVVVYLVPRGAARAARRTGTRPPLIITSRTAAFDPDLVAVAFGRKIVFANEGPLSHTLFSADLAGPRFKLPPGTRSRDIGLPRVGPIRFYCSLHSDETFLVFVGDAEHIAVVEGRTWYSLGPVEAGRYTLTLWSELVSGPIRDVMLDGYSRAVERVWIDPALVRRAAKGRGREGSR